MSHSQNSSAPSPFRGRKGFAHWSRWRWASLIALAVLAGLSWKHSITTLNCCSQCGVMTTARYLFAFKVHSRLQPSALSDSATVAALVPPHEHDWHLVHGAGGLTSCLIGDGHTFAQVAGDEQFVAKLDQIHLKLGAVESRRVLEFALNPETSRWAHSAFTDSLEDFPLGASSYRFWYDNAWAGLRQRIEREAPLHRPTGR